VVRGADVGLRPTSGVGIWMLTVQYPVHQELGRGRANSGAGNIGLVTHRLAQAHRPRCHMLAFVPWTAGSRIDPIVGWMDWGFRDGLSYSAAATKPASPLSRHNRPFWGVTVVW
jgi:hypothetical protein